MIDAVLTIFIGIALGIFCGIIPGMHINLIAAFLFGISGSFLGLFTPIGAMSLIVSAAVSANFFEFIKSAFLMTPSEGAALSIHPFKTFLENGRILEAINLFLQDETMSLKMRYRGLKKTCDHSWERRAREIVRIINFLM